MRKWLKRLKYVPVGLLIIAVVGVILFLSCRGCGGDITPVAKEGHKNANTEKTSTFLDRINPLKKTPTKADVLLEGWSAGTRIVEVTPQKETVYIAVPPSGPIQVPEHVTGVTVYEKPDRDWGLEFRPFLGAGVSIPLAPAAIAGVDVFHVGRIHTGPALVVDTNSVSGAWTAACTIVRNVDVRGGGGYGTKGGMGFAGVSVGIE